MYAVFEDRNQQHRVAEGDRVLLPHNAALEEGATCRFEQVYVITGDDPRIGSPFVQGAAVTATVVRQGVKGPKLIVQKIRRRKNSRRRTGFRARYTEVRIDKIEA